jgi:hypothetical protein
MHAHRIVATLCLFSLGCGTAPESKREGTGHSVLAPLAKAASYLPKVRQTVYVPVYSSVYWGFDERTTEIAATLSIRNISPRHKIVIHSAKYYDSEGKEIRNYVTTASELGPLATADFVVQQRDTAGGSGANFLVDWSSAEDVDEPVIEAVMIGQHGNAGISFKTEGRSLLKEPSTPR